MAIFSGKAISNIKKVLLIGIFIVFLVCTLFFLFYRLPVYTTPQEETSVLSTGAVLPLSGKSAAYGNWIREALFLVEDETNLKGGIYGRKLNIIFEDDEGKPSVAASAMQKLATIDKVPVVFGSWISSSVLAMAPIAERTQTVLMAEAISPQIREAGDYVFRFDPDARLALATLIPFVASRNHQRIGIFYINNDFGLDQAEVFKHGLDQRGYKIIFDEGYDPAATDFRSALSKLKDLNVDAVFMPGYLEMATILKQATELRLNAQFYSSFPFENPTILEIAGNAAEGVIYPFFFDSESNNPLMAKYQETYQKRYGRKSEGFAALAYFGMGIIVDIIQHVGPDAGRIKDALYKTQDVPTGFGPISFDEKGDIDIPIILKTVREGLFKVYDDGTPPLPTK